MKKKIPAREGSESENKQMKRREVSERACVMPQDVKCGKERERRVFAFGGREAR